MSEKQIDIDAMRALAKDLSHASNWRTCDCPICSGRRLLRAAADEIEQLRKDKRAENEAHAIFTGQMSERYDALLSSCEQLRKERDALRGFIELETEQCPKSHVGGPCGQCTARRAALAAQGDKPHD